MQINFDSNKIGKSIKTHMLIGISLLAFIVVYYFLLYPYKPNLFALLSVIIVCTIQSILFFISAYRLNKICKSEASVLLIESGFLIINKGSLFGKTKVAITEIKAINNPEKLNGITYYQVWLKRHPSQDTLLAGLLQKYLITLNDQFIDPNELELFVKELRSKITEDSLT